MGERITTELARELVEAATPGPWRISDPDGIAPRVSCPDFPICWVAGDTDGRPWIDEFEPGPGPLADAALIAAAPDLAADLIDARAENARLTAERDEARSNYRFMVERAADTRLDGYRELGATAAAAENASDALRTEIARLTADLVAITGDYTAATLRAETLSGEVLRLTREVEATMQRFGDAAEDAADARERARSMVTVEEHARAVREAFWSGFAARCAGWLSPITGWKYMKGETPTCDPVRTNLIATLARHVGPERAAALADGVGGGE